MRLKCILPAVLVLLIAAISTASAVQVQSQNVTLSNLTSWSNATVLAYRSILSPTETDAFYFTHNASYYFIAAKLYDNDNAADEVLSIYLYNGARTYMVKIAEGNDTATLYDVTTGVPVKIATLKAYSKVSSIRDPYAIMAVEIPKTLLGNATNLRVFIQRRSDIMRGMLEGCLRFIRHIRFMQLQHWHWGWMHMISEILERLRNLVRILGTYPPNAVYSNVSTWANLTFVSSFGNNTLHVTLPAVAGFTTIDLYNGTSTSSPYIASLPASTSMTFSVPTNVTLVVNVSGIPVLTQTLYVNGSLNATLQPNIKVVNTGFAKTIIAVEQGTNFTAYFNSSINATVVDIYATQPARVFIESTTKMVILNATHIVYNPITNRAELVVYGHRTIYIKYPRHVCVLMATNLTKCVFKKAHLILKVGNGTVIIRNPKIPFAIANNGTAMKRDIQYVDNDGGNITVINTSGGLLDVYYKNPCSVSVSVNLSNVTVVIKTPYNFHGLVNVTVNGKTVYSKKIFVKSPKTVVNISVSNLTKSSLSTAASSAYVTVYDLDSKQTIGKQSVTVKFRMPRYAIVLLLILFGLAIIAVIIVTGKKSKHAMRERMMREFKYYRRKT